ncbi:hypothetical protein [Aquimarina macrocephali]|uniref:hypothetical protein n=1 Tax=Aquimarina macrocephali TaxID=666563 RepID=UPI003F67DB5A
MRENIDNVKQLMPFVSVTNSPLEIRTNERSGIESRVLRFKFNNCNVNIDLNEEIIGELFFSLVYWQNKGFDVIILFEAYNSSFKSVIMFDGLAEVFNKEVFLIDRFNVQKCNFERLYLMEHINFINIHSSIIKKLDIWRNVSDNMTIKDVEFEKLFLQYNGTSAIQFLTNVTVKKEIQIKNEVLSALDIRFLNLNKATQTNLSTLRKIKLELEQRGNTFDFLNVLACEQKVIFRELIQNFQFSKLGEIILLLLNRISNNFGTNWLRGVFFTIMVGLLGSLGIYYSMYDGPYVSDGISPKFLSILFGNFAPLYRIAFLEENQAGLTVYLIHFITKIFVFYGIFQTVQAFRKYKK